MESKLTKILLFFSSVFAFCISLKSFWNIAIFVDQTNTSPSIIMGGDFWLYMEWVKLGLLLLICVVTGVQLFRALNPPSK